MGSHRLRVQVIGLVTCLSVIGIVILIAMDKTEGTGFGTVIGIAGTSFTALLDAVRVESRRKNPRIRAITDDVVWENGHSKEGLDHEDDSTGE